MHFTSAALFLLLVPATRAAAIPNQGDLSGAGDALLNKGDLANALGNDVLKGAHLDGPATARRDEVGGVFGTVGKTVGGALDTVNEAEDIVGASIPKSASDGLAAAKRDEAASFLGSITDAPAKLEQTVSEEAGNVVGRPAATRHGEADELPGTTQPNAGPVLDKPQDIFDAIAARIKSLIEGVGGGIGQEKRDEDADVLANSIRKLTYEQIGALAKLLKVIGGRDSATASLARL
jgi:uncharacterized protein YjbJ (UPF0337 family)